MQDSDDTDKAHFVPGDGEFEDVCGSGINWSTACTGTKQLSDVAWFSNCVFVSLGTVSSCVAYWRTRPTWIRSQHDVARVRCVSALSSSVSLRMSSRST